MAATTSSGRAEVDTSRAFRSVKEAVALFGERILARETQVRLGVRADYCIVRERSSWRDAVAIASSKEKLEVSHGVRPTREIHPSPNAIAFAITKHEGYSYSSTEPATNLMPVSDAQQMCLVPLSPPLSVPAPSISHNGEANLMIMSSIKKVEEEAAKTRQEAVQLKKRLSELELAMANLNAKLHRTLSKLAHMEADKAAAARASIQQRDNNNTVALAVWTEPKPERVTPRHPLGHLLSLDDADEEVIHVQRRDMSTVKKKVQKQKPIVPLVVPLVNDMLFSKKKGMKDKESLYMKELYSLLRLS